MTASNLETEAVFFADGLGRGRERPYGWGWLLTLAHELSIWDDPDGRAWTDAVRPLVDVLTANLLSRALPYVVGGDYMVEHWLAAYAVGYSSA